MGDRGHPYGVTYGPPFTNIFRPPGAPLASQFVPPSRAAAPHLNPTPPVAAAATPAAASSAKAAEAFAQQQAADDKKRSYPTYKGKLVAQCKRKISGTEELKVTRRALLWAACEFSCMCV